MEWKDRPPRPYYAKYERVHLAEDQGWYEVYRLPGDVYGIAEPRHFQEVNCFLILGTERALLLDTGMGIVPLQPVIDALYRGAILTVNSHFHFDHIGTNHRCGPVYGCVDRFVKAVAASGLGPADLGDQLNADMFRGGYPAGFTPDRYRVSPYVVREVTDGHVFDLGNRQLRVLHTPGHSGDSLMLYDEANRILFTGDTFYLGALYAHFDSPQFGHSDLGAYHRTMVRLSREIPPDISLYCSHNDFIAPARKLGEVAAVLNAALSTEPVPEERGVDEWHQYLETGEALYEKPGDGFSIVYRA